MKIFNHHQIQELEKYFRANLINTASGMRSPFLIGTANEDSQTNLAIFNSVVHIGANPPCLGFIMRPHTVERHTYENIKATNYFTLNLVHKDILKKAHQTSAKYPANQSEFEQCGLTAEYLEDFPAPFVKESNLKMGLKLVEEQPIEFNKTILLIGQIESLILLDDAIEADGSIDHEILNTITVSGLYSYYKTAFITKQPYVRP